MNFSTCENRSEGTTPAADSATVETVELPGVDTSELTRREQREWSTYVSDLLAPCPDQPVSIAQCVKESRKCEACKPAADFLLTQVRRGRARSQAEAAFRVRFSTDEVKPIELGDSPSKGPKDAPVTVVEWADYECPHCGMMAPVLDQLVERFDGQVRFVFKNYPLSIHEHAEMAARAAVAAGKQGKFWEMHDLLFKKQATFTNDFAHFAKELGLDVKKFLKDIESEDVADRVAKDKKEADKLGLEGTPMIYINGRNFTSGYFDPKEDLDDFVKLEIKLRTGKDVDPKPLPKASATATEEDGEQPSTAPSGAKTAPSAKAEGKGNPGKPAPSAN
ncbi:MAG: thioredoxin domain-containing protein [Myxococcales bacterium]|nr:thioredoxin domain-containing protein [Myxococcales bacterium]